MSEKLERKPQKWIKEGDEFYPINGNTVLHPTPGNGVFELFKNNKPDDQRLGLRYVGDKFEFPFKIYDLGVDDFLKQCYDTWYSEYYMKSGKNLAIVLNGIKGTGKTISMKLLANMMELPIVVVNSCIPGVQEFIQNLDFEAVICLDEAEKAFKTTDHVDGDRILLNLLDGVLNRSRKFYVLTTNRLTINENLLGRPGRIRYIRQFGNLTEKAVNQYLDDNLLVQEKREDILKTVDLLEISTIDILKALVDEVNIHGNISEESCLNVPRAKYVFKILKFGEMDKDEISELKDFLKTKPVNLSLQAWFKSEYSEEKPETEDKKECATVKGADSSPKKVKKDEDTYTVEDYINDEWDGYLTTVTSQFSTLWKGTQTNYGEILTDVDESGMFTLKTDNWYGGTECTCLLVEKKNNPSLYRGGLIL